MKFICKEKKKYSKYNLVEGFPSPNLTATIATKYLIENLEMQEIGYVSSDRFAPVVRIKEGLPKKPIRIYKSDKHKIIAIESDQLIPQNLIKEYSKELSRWCTEKNIESIISCSSVEVKDNDEKVYGITNTAKGLKLLNKLGIQVVREGMTTGLSAELFLIEDKVNVFLLLSPRSSKTSYESASNVLKVLNKFLGTSIDTNPLIRESKKIVKETKDKFKKIDTHKESSKQIMYS